MSSTSIPDKMSTKLKINSQATTVGFFSTALLFDTDWAPSAWISPCQDQGNILRFQANSNLSSLQRAVVYVASPGTFKFWVNGKLASNHQLGAYSQFNTRVLYEAFDITDLIHTSGCNAFALMLGHGWFGLPSDPWGGPRQVRARINLHLADGKVTEFVTSTHGWITTQGPLVMDDVYNGEVYDANLEQARWQYCDFANASKWKQVCGVATAVALSLNPVPQRFLKAFPPVSHHSPAPHHHIFDFGQNMAGAITLNISGITPAMRGKTITVHHAELLFPNGSLWHHYPDQKELILYTMRGQDTTESYTPLFTYYGFRYIDIVVPDGVALRFDVVAHFVHTDLPITGSISFGNPLLNQIQRGLIYSALSNFQNVPTDCPQRERHGWLGDAHISAEANIYNLDPSLAAAYTKWLRDIADAQNTRNTVTGQNAMIPDIVPADPKQVNGTNGGPAWGAAYVIIVDYVARYFDDIRIVETHYDSLKRYVNSLTAIAKASQGLLEASVYGDWCNVRLGMPQQFPGISCAFNSSTLAQCGCNVAPNRSQRPIESAFYYILQLNIMERLASLLSKSNDASYFKNLYNNAKQVFVSHFRNSSETHLYGAGYQADTCFALFSQAALSDDVAGLQQHLLQDVMQKHDGHLTTGCIGTKYILPVLSSIDQRGIDAAYAVAAQDTAPSWGYWFKMGATTLYESWAEYGTIEQRANEAGSLNHIMLGGHGDWYYKSLAGINRGDSTNTYNISPQVPTQLTAVNASTLTIHGYVRVSWQQQATYYRLSVEIPSSGVANISMPIHLVHYANATITEGSRVVWKDGAFVEGDPGVMTGVVEPASKAVVFQVVAGTFDFLAS
eukprot:m.125506 g.125506  ORF g.125506 m.125506 type:complete len:844 (-) comp23469_c0_seq1:163-2694(-)